MREASHDASCPNVSIRSCVGRPHRVGSVTSTASRHLRGCPSGTPVRKATREYRRSIALAFAIASLSALGIYTLEAYFVTYLREVVGLDPTTAILSIATAFLMTVPLVPLIGLLGDRIGRKPLLFAGTVGFVVLSVPAYSLAATGDLFSAVLGQLLLGLLCSFVISALVVTQVELFPTRVRYSGASIGYNLGYTIFGGTALLAATYVVSATGSSIAPAIYLVVVALAVLPAVFLLPETSKLSLVRGDDTG